MLVTVFYLVLFYVGVSQWTSPVQHGYGQTAIYTTTWLSTKLQTTSVWTTTTWWTASLWTTFTRFEILSHTTSTCLMQKLGGKFFFFFFLLFLFWTWISCKIELLKIKQTDDTRHVQGDCKFRTLKCIYTTTSL